MTLSIQSIVSGNVIMSTLLWKKKKKIAKTTGCFASIFKLNKIGGYRGAFSGMITKIIEKTPQRSSLKLE